MNTPDRKLNYATAKRALLRVLGPGARMWRREIDGKQMIVVGFEQGSEKWQAGVGRDYDEAVNAALANIAGMIRSSATKPPAEGETTSTVEAPKAEESTPAEPSKEVENPGA